MTKPPFAPLTLAELMDPGEAVLELEELLREVQTEFSNTHNADKARGRVCARRMVAVARALDALRDGKRR